MYYLALFANIKVPAVLTDDGIAIYIAWDIKNNNFEVYEDDWRDNSLRWDLR